MKGFSRVNSLDTQLIQCANQSTTEPELVCSVIMQLSGMILLAIAVVLCIKHGVVVSSQPIASPWNDVTLNISLCKETDNDLVEVGDCDFPPKINNRHRNSCRIKAEVEDQDEYCYTSTGFDGVKSAYCDGQGSCWCHFNETLLTVSSCHLYRHKNYDAYSSSRMFSYIYSVFKLMVTSN